MYRQYMYMYVYMIYEKFSEINLGKVQQPVILLCTRNDIVLLTWLAKQDVCQVGAHDVIVRVCVYVGGATTRRCADTDVAKPGALGRCQGQLKHYTTTLYVCEQTVKE